MLYIIDLAATTMAASRLDAKDRLYPLAPAFADIKYGNVLLVSDDGQAVRFHKWQMMAYR